MTRMTRIDADFRFEKWTQMQKEQEDYQDEDVCNHNYYKLLRIAEKPRA